MILHAGKLSIKFSNGSYEKKPKENNNRNTRTLSCLYKNGTYFLFNPRTYHYLSAWGGGGRVGGILSDIMVSRGNGGDQSSLTEYTTGGLEN